MKKRIPKFSSEAEEREFWATADSTEYVDWKKGKRMMLPKLRPSLKTISLRLPELMLEELKVLANKRDVPYQSLLKVYLGERIEKELKVAVPRERRSNYRLKLTARQRKA
jgi:predicted DNA binding CopG/RHH family protein